MSGAEDGRLTFEHRRVLDEVNEGPVFEQHQLVRPAFNRPDLLELVLNPGEQRAIEHVSDVEVAVFQEEFPFVVGHFLLLTSQHRNGGFHAGVL